MIEEYRFGRLTFQGQEYTSDVIIHGDNVTSWWRKTGHAVVREDIEALVLQRPTVIVIGTGKVGMVVVSPETRLFIQEHGVQLIVEKTATAVKTFNRLRAEAVDVAIALHLTC